MVIRSATEFHFHPRTPYYHLCVHKAYALTGFRSPHNPCIIAVDPDRPVPSKLFSIADYKMAVAVIELICMLGRFWISLNCLIRKDRVEDVRGGSYI